MYDLNASEIYINKDLYAAQRDCGGCLAAPTLLISSLIASLAVAGIAMNAFVVFVSRSLNGTANFLLALTSFFEMCHQSGYLLLLYTALFRPNNYYMDYGTNVWALSISLFGLRGAWIAIICTGLDRLLCILFPLQFHNLDPRLTRVYLALQTAFCCVCSLAMVVQLHWIAAKLGQVKAMATLLDTWSTPQKTNFEGPEFEFYTSIFYWYNYGSNGCAIVIYSLVGLVLWLRRRNAAHAKNGRIFRALLTICLVNLGCYFITVPWSMFVIQWMKDYKVDGVARWFSSLTFNSVMANIAAGSNAIILYLNRQNAHFFGDSMQYRKAFQKDLRMIEEKLCFA